MLGLELSTIWALIIAIGVMMYVLLDGFDLGVGILTSLARSEDERSMMTATIEPVWDGNETWLIIGGGGLFAAFPLAYAVLMPAFYLPLLIMLAALIFRGVAFEFRHKAVRRPTKMFWNGAFAGGSLVAALSQGMMLGALIQGVVVETVAQPALIEGALASVDRPAFAGGAFDWLTPFTLLTGAAVAAGYVLLGACWLFLKTEGEAQERARRWGRASLLAVAAGFVAVSLATLVAHPNITERWGLSFTNIEFAQIAPLAPIPLLGAALLYLLWRDFAPHRASAPDWRPYLLAAGVFVTGYLGLGVSLFPHIVPFTPDMAGADGFADPRGLTVAETAARDNALMLMLVGALIMLPIILAYTAYVYSLFWGKVREGDGYHA